MDAMQVYSLRLPASLVAAIREDLAKGLEHSPDPADTLTAWITRACRERLAHRCRSRARRRRKVQRDNDGWPQIRVGLAGREEGC
jgi:DNA-directed RNA polymerase specialized sigma24 family protein